MFYTRINKIKVFDNREGFLGLFNRHAEMRIYSYVRSLNVAPMSLEQYRCPDWFRDAKFGIYSHWNAYSVPAQGDWYARNMYIEGSKHYNYHVKHYGHPSKVGYKDIIEMWKAENFAPDKIIALDKEAGAKYFVAVAAHHDNFDLWNSRHHEWNSVNHGPRQNIVG